MGPSGKGERARAGRAIRFAFLLRYPLVLAVGLVALGVWGPGSNLLGSLFAMRAWDVAVLTCFGSLGSWVLVLNLHVLVRWAPMRFGVGPDDLPTGLAAAGRRVGRLRWWAAPLLCAPLLAAVVRESGLGFGQWLPPLLVGGASATGILWLLSGLAEAPQQRTRFFPDTAPVRWIHSLFSSIKQRVFLERPLPLVGRLLGPGYADEQGRMLSGHLFLGVFFGLALTGYGVLGFALRPDGAHPEAVPALAYLLMLWTLAVWLLSAASFLFDGLRIPPLLALAGLSYVLYCTSGTDHYYEAWQEETPLAETRADRAANRPEGDRPRYDRLAPGDAREAWLRGRPAGDRDEILVATSGGGITAAAWTAHVLTELELRHGERFTRQLGLVSAVSGGSVGTLFYLYDFERTGRGPDALEAIRCRVTEPSLRQVAWGAAYPDAWRLLLAPLANLFPLRDRGWALEVAWQRMLARELRPGSAEGCAWREEDRGVDRLGVDAFSDWRARIGRGELPVPIFNATVSDTGEMLLLSPVDLEAGLAKPDFAEVLTLRRLYPKADLAVTTAARLSATFPYVTPIARSSLERCDPESSQDEPPGCVPYADYHVADGGYYDNFGVASLAAWVRASHEREAPRPPRLLVVEIRAFESLPPRPTGGTGAPRAGSVPAGRSESGSGPPRPPGDDGGWMWAVLGPLSTMLEVRTRSQLVRNDSHLDLLADHYEKLGSCIVRVPFELTAELPLSWQLGPNDGERIRHALTENEASFAKVRSFLDGSGCS